MRAAEISIKFMKTIQTSRENKGFSLRARLRKLRRHHDLQARKVKLQISNRRTGQEGTQLSVRHVPTMLLSINAQMHSDGGSAMPMKCPDDIWREAGSGPTLNWNGPNEFRARP